MESFDLGGVEVDPVKLSRGVFWRIWRGDDGQILGTPIAEPDPAAPWLLIVPRGIAFDAALREEEAPFREKMRAGQMTEDERQALLGRVHARATLRGWGNISERGAAVQWSEAKAAELMSDARWKAVRDFVVAAHLHLSAAARDEEEKAAGN